MAEIVVCVTPETGFDPGDPICILPDEQTDSVAGRMRIRLPLVPVHWLQHLTKPVRVDGKVIARRGWRLRREHLRVGKVTPLELSVDILEGRKTFDWFEPK